jgi:hypothetical protein
MKKLFFIFALLAVMVMQVPQASAAGPPGQEEISIALQSAQADVQYVAQYAMMPDVSFAADLPVLVLKAPADFRLFKLCFAEVIQFQHPPNINRVGMISFDTDKLIENSHYSQLGYSLWDWYSA